MWAQVSFVLSQSMLVTDGQTEGQTYREKGLAILCVALYAVAQ